MTIFKLHRGEAIDVLRTMPDNSVDSIVTDPPYGLKFMNRHWDYDIPDVDTWRECLRVLKPGGHLLAFAGTRTQHRMACCIEDAGFEIRDMIAWVYGSGFPKSLDISKAIDKAAGAVREVVGSKLGMPGYSLKPNDTDEHDRTAYGKFTDPTSECSVTAPATADAAKWQGWGSALKPALEPITVARKPLAEKTLAANVLAHGTGAINIDGCRVALTGDADADAFANNHAVTERLPERYDGEPLGMHNGGWKQRVGPAVVPPGRWPANLLHDGSDEVLAAFPSAPGQLAKAATGGDRIKDQNVYGAMTRGSNGSEPRTDAGSAARFFYCGKATRKDRGDGNHHTTVKPTDLMRYLVRLVTPPGGLTLDPFVGSGSTGKAAVLEGFRFIGIDRDADENGASLGYLDIARARILHAGGVEQGTTPPNLLTLMSRLSVAIDALLAARSTNRGRIEQPEEFDL